MSIVTEEEIEYACEFMKSDIFKGFATPKGDQEYAEHLIKSFSNFVSPMDVSLKFYKKHLCWPHVIPRNLIWSAINDYSTEEFELYDLIFRENDTKITMRNLLSAMTAAEEQRPWFDKLNWCDARDEFEIFEKTPLTELISPNDFLDKIDLKKYRKIDYTPFKKNASDYIDQTL